MIKIIKIINKGGGSKTIQNGLSYEKLTNIDSEFNIISVDKHFKIICFKKSNTIMKIPQKSNLFASMNNKLNKNITKAHGCKKPDECYINETNKTIFILEKKFQQTSGSVCEKIQTSEFKIWQYSRSFSEYKIIYMYCLSDWFKKNCKAELEYLEYKKVPVFWGNDINYKTQLVEFLINYK